MTFTPCVSLDVYAPLWEKFAGDPDLLEEIMEHKTNCDACQSNMREARRLEMTELERWLESEMLIGGPSETC